MQTEPSLDKFIGNWSGVSASLEPSITWAEKMVPFEKHGSTPVFVLATAGLRRLAMEEAREIFRGCRGCCKGIFFYVWKKLERGVKWERRSLLWLGCFEL